MTTRVKSADESFTWPCQQPCWRCVEQPCRQPSRPRRPRRRSHRRYRRCASPCHDYGTIPPTRTSEFLVCAVDIYLTRVYSTRMKSACITSQRVPHLALPATLLALRRGTLPTAAPSSSSSSSSSPSFSPLRLALPRYHQRGHPSPSSRGRCDDDSGCAATYRTRPCPHPPVCRGMRDQMQPSFLAHHVE